MLPEPPRPDGPDFSGSEAGTAGAERATLSDGEALAAARHYWEAVADAYQAEHGAFLSGRSHAHARVADDGSSSTAGPANATGGLDHPRPVPAFVWGPEGHTEVDLAVIGPPATRAGGRTLEVGCGAAQCSAWLTAHGAHAVGIDLAVNQLRHAPPAGASDPTPAGGSGRPPAAGSLTLLAAFATALPFRDDTFDLAFSAYGAVQFVSDLGLLLAEVARVLRPGGRWAMSVTHPIRWAFPDDPGQLGLGVSGSYFDRTPYVERDVDGVATYAEFHRTLSDYVAAHTRAGFTLDTLLEPEWPDWNDETWGGWSPLRGWYLPGTLIIGGQLRS